MSGNRFVILGAMAQAKRDDLQLGIERLPFQSEDFMFDRVGEGDEGEKDDASIRRRSWTPGEEEEEKNENRRHMDSLSHGAGSDYSGEEDMATRPVSTSVSLFTRRDGAGEGHVNDGLRALVRTTSDTGAFPAFETPVKRPGTKRAVAAAHNSHSRLGLEVVIPHGDDCERGEHARSRATPTKSASAPKNSYGINTSYAPFKSKSVKVS